MTFADRPHAHRNPGAPTTPEDRVSRRAPRVAPGAAGGARLLPRLIRARDAPFYLGMDRNRFQAEVRPLGPLHRPHGGADRRPRHRL